MKANFYALLSGSLFGAGLLVSRMTDPARIRGFLDVFGAWDPSLMAVMVGAIGVHVVLYRIVVGQASPMFGSKFHLPTSRQIDARLVVGSAAFGIGWALAGYCPGPAIISVASGGAAPLVFLTAMTAGMVLEAVNLGRPSWIGARS